MLKLITTAAIACLGATLLPTLASAQTPLPEAQVNALEALGGKHPGFRRARAKGLCASGYFEGLSGGRELSSATVFSGARLPVIARFSVGGGNPQSSDKSRSARGLALQIDAPGGETWVMANISAPVYFVRTPEDFVSFLQVRTNDPATGKPDPETLKAFNPAHPETLRQAAYLAQAPVAASFGAVNYWGVNTFEMQNAQGTRQAVRWQFVPEAGTLGLSEEQMKSLPTDFLAAEMRQRVAQAPVVFDLRLQLAEPGDDWLDPTQAWPDNRRQVAAGRLVIDQVSQDKSGSCDRLTFNPLVTPRGITPSADPVLQARAAAYGLSFGRRLSEAAQ